MTYASEALAEPFHELDVIATQSTIGMDDVIYPSGSRGTIVHVHRGGTAYEVEFTDPEPAVLTLEREDIGVVLWRA